MKYNKLLYFNIYIFELGREMYALFSRHAFERNIRKVKINTNHYICIMKVTLPNVIEILI